MAAPRRGLHRALIIPTAVMADDPELIPFRSAGNPAAIVFLHGYGGNAATTWGRFPAFLLAEPKLARWDVYSVGYHTRLFPDLLRGIWSASPDLPMLADVLRSTSALPPLDSYGALALVAHSMGGLVAQQALLEPRFRARVQHLFLFGTPSAGLRKASLGGFLMRQVRDMGHQSRFITGLRQAWTEQVAPRPGFGFWPIAGDQDEFVGRESSVAPFGEPYHAVPGDHLSMVKPKSANGLAVKYVVSGITEGAAPSGPRDSALIAVERGQFRQAVDTLLPHAGELDDDALVMLAIALDAVGRQDEAVEVLRSRGERAGTDVMGTLGGRIKRRWVGERRAEDGELAMRLYGEAFARAAAAPADHGQCCYHAINLAFLALLFRKDLSGAREWAARAMAHCDAQEAAGAHPRETLWREATRGEALLTLGRTHEALAAYARALDQGPDPWQALSMYWQARLVAEDLRQAEADAGLQRLFEGEG